MLICQHDLEDIFFLIHGLFVIRQSYLEKFFLQDIRISMQRPSDVVVFSKQALHFFCKNSIETPQNKLSSGKNSLLFIQSNRSLLFSSS